MEGDPATSAEPVRFRVGKKRKAYRQRVEEDVGHAADQGPSDSVPVEAQGVETDKGDREEDEGDAIQAALKLRNARRGRLQGVSFTANSQIGAHGEQSLVVRQPEELAKGIPDRFTHQTGLAMELNDKHMEQYIESRLSSRTAGSTTEHVTAPDAASSNTSGLQATNSITGGQTASRGKLLEVDLSQQDFAKREIDRKRLFGGQDSPEKPKRRNRNRRGSDDIKRDQLVEAFLTENKLDVYNVPAAQNKTGSSASGKTLSADDIMAEQFQRQYMDELAMRNARRRPAINQPKGASAAQQAAEEVLKGPKLGGSKNNRTAVRNALLMAQERGKQR
ncbi:hypothetical protein VHEMI06348 [[Torrubiella] hemipterigena]|uniref:mRNA splicing factor RNA helicase n=1 Tax=[Torrubiella] hemipterigena TaxID=1531966 RepID=A0A0A1T703_9HYPO|nr:hypothetical protein VHEMI06348 [[Torrubiella] hemipterigena]